MPKRMAKHEFNVYASTKTSAQLILDLAATTSHAMTLYIITMNLTRRDMVWQILFYALIVTISIQAVLALGLFMLRMVTYKNGGSIPRIYKVLNDIFFWGCLIVAALEVGVAAIEKFGLGHSYVDFVNGTNSAVTGINNNCASGSQVVTEAQMVADEQFM